MPRIPAAHRRSAINLVVGATGFLGREICRLLASRGEPVRGLVRATSDPATVEGLRDLEVETVVGDLKDPASLEDACEGARVVISTATAPRSRQEGDSIESADEGGQLNLVRAAESQGVSRFVYVSVSSGIGSNDPLTQAKRSVERAIQESDMRYTILRPTFFMEAWLGPDLGFDAANAKATIYGDGENRISWISLADVAEFAVASADDPEADDVVLELGGPDALSPREVVRIYEELGGRSFELQHVPEEALHAQAVSATDSLQQTFSALMLGYASGDEVEMEETLKRFPVRLTSIREYAQRGLGQS